MPHDRSGTAWTRWRTASLAVLVAGSAFALSPVATPALALAAGMIIALAPGNPWTERTGVVASRLLQASVVMLGFGLSLEQLASTGARGIAYTGVSIIGVFALGHVLRRLFGVERDLSMLVTTGTSICGGSAIAAMAPAIGARREAIAMALATVFVLNAVALYVFPPIGVALGLTQHQFGLWVAIAIHDTSSVVGAASTFGAQALQDATILKLVRALWILPLVLIVSGSRGRRGGSPRRLPVPWFVAGFVLAAAVRSVELFESAATLDGLAMLGRRLLVLSLFAVGASLSLAQLRQIGIRPFGQGVVLWLLVSAITLGAIMVGVSA